MRRADVQKELRKSDIQGEVFSLLWNRRKNINGVRLKDMANHLNRSADRVKNALTVLINKDIANQVSRGVYEVSKDITV